MRRQAKLSWIGAIWTLLSGLISVAFLLTVVDFTSRRRAMQTSDGEALRLHALNTSSISWMWPVVAMTALVGLTCSVFLLRADDRRHGPNAAGPTDLHLATASRPRVDFIEEAEGLAWRGTWAALALLAAVLSLYAVSTERPMDYPEVAALTALCVHAGISLITTTRWQWATNRRPEVVVDPDGLTLKYGRTLAWEEIIGIDDGWRGTCRRVRVVLSDKSGVWLGAPRSYRWRGRDRRFDADLDVLRNWARQYGAQVGGTTPYRPTRTVLLVLLLVALSSLIGIRAAQRGLILPGPDLATHLPTTCAGGGPATVGTFELTFGGAITPELNSTALPERSSCAWFFTVAGVPQTYGELHLHLLLFKANTMASPRGQAANAFNFLNESLVRSVAVAGLGDHSVLGFDGPSMYLRAIQSNVVVSAAVQLNGAISQSRDMELLQGITSLALSGKS